MEEKLENLVDVLKKFSTAMLVTRTDEGDLRSRPMAIADCNDVARLWFVTRSDSGKIDEMTEFPSVNISMQDGKHFLSISGTARISNDRDRIHQLWNAPMKIWFDGPDDPTIRLLEIVPMHAEYWDRSGIEGIKLLLASARAVVTGEPPAFDKEVHAKLDFPEHQLES